MKQTDEKGNPLTYWGGLEEPKQEPKKQTAVEWLVEQTRKPEWHSLKRQDILDEALKIEKQQIIDACYYGKKYHEKFDYTSEQYYNETFKKK